MGSELKLQTNMRLEPKSLLKQGPAPTSQPNMQLELKLWLEMGAKAEIAAQAMSRAKTAAEDRARIKVTAKMARAKIAAQYQARAAVAT